MWEKEINDIVLSKCDWILNRLNNFKNKNIENSSKIPFLREYFDLKIIKSDKILNCKFEFDKEKFIAYIPTFMTRDIYNK